MSSIKDFLIGDTTRYNYGDLCKPQLPCAKQESKKGVPFYAHDEPLPFFLAAIMGLQHAFAMVGGLITVPFVVFRFSVDFGNTELQQYAISAALIACGICTLINISKIPLPFTEKIFGRQLFLGSGVLSVSPSCQSSKLVLTNRNKPVLIRWKHMETCWALPWFVDCPRSSFLFYQEKLSRESSHHLFPV